MANEKLKSTHIEENDILSAKTLIAIAILFLYTISSPIFEKLNFQYIIIIKQL